MASSAAPESEEVHVPVDSDDSALDSDYGSIHEGSDTTSLASTMYHFPVENGRRYHKYKEGEYWGPNDEQQSDQLDILHHIYLTMLDGKLFLAPIGENPQKVLDIGTGTGIWAIDFADQFPSAEVIGTDLSPTQPSWVPPNLRFQIDDASEEWTFPRDSFDYIHVRGLYGCIRDWPAFYKEVLKHLKPGAWFEQLEYSVHWRCDDGSIPEGHVFQRWSDIFVEAGERIGKTFRILDLQKGYMQDTGFVDVVEHRYKMPVGPWSSDPKLKEIGRWHLFECYQGIEGWSIKLLTQVMGWSIEEVQLFLADVRKAFKDKRVHGYTTVSLVYGRKPPIPE